MLISGEAPDADVQHGAGNISSTFISAEGQEERSLRVADGAATLQVIAIVGVESGDLRIDLLQPNRSVVFAVHARPDTQVTRSGQVQTDDQGYLHYRIVARGARNGSFQLLFQP